MKKTNNIGIGVTAPKETCTDRNCPFHGDLTVRGREFVGVVKSDKMSRTVTVYWERKQYIPKFERYEKKFSKVKAHNPDCISAKIGDKVRIKECRPLSKLKNFVVVEKIVEGEQNASA